MKKGLQIFFTALLGIGMLTGCGKKKCSHEYKVAFDATGHWEVCEKCNDETDKENHVLVNKNDSEGHWQECECGYKTTKIAHTLAKKYDEVGHWEECSCGYKTEKAAHTLGYGKDATGHWEECSDCDYKTDRENHVHETKWNDASHWDECECGHKEHTEPHDLIQKSDATQHWNECECGYVTERSYHIFNKKIKSADYLASAATCKEYAKYYYACAVCEYKGTNTWTDEEGGYEEHVAKSTYCYNDTYHWHDCEKCNETVGLEKHNFKTSISSSSAGDQISFTCECGYKFTIKESDAAIYSATIRKCPSYDQPGELIMNAVTYALPAYKEDAAKAANERMYYDTVLASAGEHNAEVVKFTFRVYEPSVLYFMALELIKGAKELGFNEPDFNVCSIIFSIRAAAQEKDLSWICPNFAKQGQEAFGYVNSVASITGRGTVLETEMKAGGLSTNEFIQIINPDGTIKESPVIAIEVARVQIGSTVAGETVGILVRGISTTEVSVGAIIMRKGDTVKKAGGAIVYMDVWTKEEGGRHTGFWTNYKPDLYFSNKATVKGTFSFISTTQTISDDLEMVAPGTGTYFKVAFDAPIMVTEGMTFKVSESSKFVGDAVVISTLNVLYSTATTSGADVGYDYDLELDESTGNTFYISVGATSVTLRTTDNDAGTWLPAWVYDQCNDGAVVLDIVIGGKILFRFDSVNDLGSVTYKDGIVTLVFDAQQGFDTGWEYFDSSTGGWIHTGSVEATFYLR